MGEGERDREREREGGARERDQREIVFFNVTIKKYKMKTKLYKMNIFTRTRKAEKERVNERKRVKSI